MQRHLARAIDAAFFRWQVRAAQLRRRTAWPPAHDLQQLRAGAWRTPRMGGGPAAELTLEQSAEGAGLAFASSEPYAQPHDRVARGRLYLPAGAVRGAALLIPGALTGAPRNGSQRLYPRVAAAFTRLGLAAARIELPLHERRAPAGEISGHEMFQGDLFTYARAVAQGVRDVQALAGWLRAEYGPVGLWGLSLGALIGALAAQHDARLSWAVLLQPPLQRDAAWRSPFSAPMREQMLAAGLARGEVEAVLGGLAPSGSPAVSAARILLQCGRWDRLAPAAGIAALAQRWPGAQLRIYDEGHISMLFGRRWLDDGAQFVERQLRAER